MPEGRFCYLKFLAWRPDHHLFLHRVPVNLYCIYTNNTWVCRGFMLQIKQLTYGCSSCDPASQAASHACILTCLIWYGTHFQCQQILKTSRS